MTTAGRGGSPRPRLLVRWRSSEFARHVLELMSGTALAQVIPLLATVVMTRFFYTPAEFGVFTMIVALVSTVVTVAALRYDLAIVLPDSDTDAKRLLFLCTRINLVVAAVTTVVLTVLAAPIAGALNLPALAPWLWAVGPLSLVTEQAQIMGYWLNRRRQYRRMGLNKVTLASAASGTQLALGAARFGVLGLVVGQLAGAALALVVIWRRVRPDLAAVTGAPRPHLLREYRRMPLLNGPNAVADAVRVNGINALIGAYFAAGVLGQFGLAWRLLQAPLALINGALQQVFFQRLARTPRGQMTRVVRASIVRSAALGAVPFGLIALAAPPVVTWALGEQWALAGVIAATLAPWLYLNLITSPVSTVFIVVESQLELLLFALVFMAVPLGLIWWRHADIVETLTWVSWSMTGMLVVFLVLALFVARRFDRGEASAVPQAATPTE